MGYEALKDDDLGYSALKDFRLEIDEKVTSFSLCFWVFLPNSTPFPCTILRQLHSKNTFLSLKEDRRINLSTPFLFHKKDGDPSSDTSHAKTPSVVSEEEFPLGRWVHLGCEVSTSLIRIHLDGKVAGERSLDSSLVKDVVQSDTRMILSAIDEGNEGHDGYVHNAEISSSTLSIENHHIKDPPLHLCLDSTSTPDIEVDNDGVWVIVGGKASCCKTMSLDVLLLNAFGQPVDKELEVMASLVYANERAPVEKTEDGEPSLLTICDGLEFPCHDRPTKLRHGRASFMLKVSQLSSKCDNRLLCIKFDIPKMRYYPFLEAFSPSIRCISRTRNTKISTITWKKLPSGVHLFNGSNSPKYGNGYPEMHQNGVCEQKPSSKRLKLGRDISLTMANGDVPVERPDEECNSYTVATNKEESVIRTSLESLQENYGGMDNSASDSESVGARNTTLKNVRCKRDLITDLTIFRYCLGGLSERLLMLKEISLFISEHEMADMAQQVSLFSGCSHHRNQIMMAQRLLEEGKRTWSLISQNSSQVRWDSVVFEIEEQFMRISCCSSRSLTQEDFNFLRSFGGPEYMTRDDFDKMWRWLFPVAYTISRPEVNALWASTKPMWIVGFITKEEVEYSLNNPLGIQEPGTFILRFPTSRSWPHPDAGSLVASYIGDDFSLHHRQLSLDNRSGKDDTNIESLQELIMLEPELSRVGRCCFQVVAEVSRQPNILDA